MVRLEDIVVTGYGLKIPGAKNKQEFHHILEGGICTHSILKGKGRNQGDIIAGLIDDEFETLGNRNYRRYPRSTRLAIAAARDAVDMSGLSADPRRIGVIIGTSAGAILEVEAYAPVASGLKRYPIHGVSIVDSHTISSTVAEHISAKGPAFTITTGCTASLDAVSLGKLLLKTGQVDACIVGGTDAPLGQWSINGFLKMRAIQSASSISDAGVPFSDQHDGFVLAEGAAMLILERREDALKGGRTIHGSIGNVVSRNEGKPMLQVDETGEEMLSVLQAVMEDVTPTYVNSQALGLKVNDRIESMNHHRMFNGDVPITSIKGMTGHSFAAMGAIQTISSILSIEYGFIPPTIKTRQKGFESLPLVRETVYQPVSSVSITTHGISGNNACMLISK